MKEKETTSDETEQEKPIDEIEQQRPMYLIDFMGHETADLKMEKCQRVGCNIAPNGYYTCRCCSLGEGFWDGGDYAAYCSSECATLSPNCGENCAVTEDIVCKHCYGCTFHGCSCGDESTLDP